MLTYMVVMLGLVHAQGMEAAVGYDYALSKHMDCNWL